MQATVRYTFSCHRHQHHYLWSPRRRRRFHRWRRRGRGASAVVGALLQRVEAVAVALAAAVRKQLALQRGWRIKPARASVGDRSGLRLCGCVCSTLQGYIPQPMTCIRLYAVAFLCGAPLWDGGTAWSRIGEQAAAGPCQVCSAAHLLLKLEERLCITQQQRGEAVGTISILCAGV